MARIARVSSFLVISILLIAGPAEAAEFENFKIESVASALSTSGAAQHPDLTTSFVLNPTSPGSGPRTEDVAISLPPGIYGNPNLVPRCSTGDLVAGACSTDSQIGISRIKLATSGGNAFTVPVFNLMPPHPEDEVARLGFLAATLPVFVDISVRTSSDYGIVAAIHSASGTEPLEAAETVIWGNPSDPSHDEQRMTELEPNHCGTPTACEADGGKRASNLPPIAFLTNPSACQEQSVAFSVTSYQLPGQIFTASAPMQPITDCHGLAFEPVLEVQPTTRQAGAPTGLRAVVRIPQRKGPNERATATMREAKVTLPDGMTISASAAQNLESCSDEQVGFHREVDAACPNASKLGTVTVVSPALERPLHGGIYQRTPSPGHQFGLWLVTDELGLHVKLPAEVVGDPKTGQLTARFADLPQLPVEEVALDFWGGARAPLKNPDACGGHAASFDFKPWSNDPDATGQASVTIDEGCGAGFSPKLRAGVTHPAAGAFSPLVLTLTREDAEDNMKGLDVTLPQGLLAKLRGVPLCPDAAASAGACPDASRIGSVLVAAGAGPEPLWIPQPGKPQPYVYLAGPYGGAPYSIVSVVTAQAGPFDLGTVVVRSGLFLDPETGVATAKTELPQVLEGATILYRTIHVVIDRPQFTLNPTDCRAMKVKATITAFHGALATPADRFQVGNCRRLKFAPHLSLRLRGGSKRRNYPALTAVLKTRKRDANIGRVSVALPHSEFLAQEHIGTICTRKRFAVHDCPKRSVYGYAKAWTPLLSKPLEGPVYLRSSSHLLPDLVAALEGQIEIDLAGRIDSTKGGIRTTFETVPDAPVSKFVLRMKGGSKGLLVNSTDICRGTHRATVKIDAQNGRQVEARQRLASDCKRGR
jgi:hypothetical protein